jgi:serine phosphatase RsbU (regulator of sigma subunit)
MDDMYGSDSSPWGGARRGGETRLAVASAAGLYLIGAALIATSFLLPDVSSPAGAAAVAGDAVLSAAALLWAVGRGRSSLELAWIAELWGIAIVTVLCASTGGATSPFALLYFFAIGHAAAFQPRMRFALTSAAGLIAFLAPLIYSTVNTNFAAIACVGAVLAVLTTVVLHLALERMRADHRRLELLIAATAKLDTSLDPQQTLRLIADTALPELAELCVIDLVDGDGTITTTVAAAIDRRLAERVEAMRPDERPEELAGQAVARALSERTSTVVQDIARSPFGEESRTGAARPGRRDAASRSATVVPMVARGRMLGVISFVHRGRAEPGQLRLLEDLTGRAALAYDNARLYAERARVAQTLRRSLMPAALPVVPGLDLESYFRPMGAGNEVGGDFYDVFADRDGCWLVVGDVCGKGADAAVMTAFLRHTAAAYARDGNSPATVLARVNRAMLEQDFEGRFATAILARLDFDADGIALTVAAAGHPAALVTRAAGTTEELGTGGTLLGIFPDARVGEASTMLGVGDSLALYTDGLSEAHAPGRLLSATEMIRALSKPPPESAEQAIASLLGLLDLSQGARDDIAILAVRVSSAAARGVRAA